MTTLRQIFRAVFLPKVAAREPPADLMALEEARERFHKSAKRLVKAVRGERIPTKKLNGHRTRHPR